MSDTRDRMVASAVVLLAKHGYQATTFSGVLVHPDAPRGSIYHHFPRGKDQLVAAAITLAGDRAIALLDSLAGAPPEEIVDGFVGLWRAVLQASAFGAGCSVLAVTVSADDRDLLELCRSVFTSWRGRLAQLLADSGVTEAADLAATLVAATEGAVVMARAERDLAPLEAVHRVLRALALAG